MIGVKGTRIALVMLVCASLLQGCARNEAERLQDVKRFIAQGDLPAALIDVKTVLQDNPASPEGRFLLGKTLLLSGDPAGAEIELRRALEGRHREGDVVPLLASALVALNRNDSVIGEFADRKLDDPAAQAELRTQVAMALLGAGRVEEAETTLKEVVASSDHRPAYEALAKIRAARGDVQAALAMTRSLLEREPRNAAAWALQGDVLLLGARPDRPAAIEAFQKALNLQPALADAHAGLLAALFASGRMDEGRKQLQAMKAVLPGHLQTRFFETIVALQDGNLVQARESVQRLLKASPDNPRLLVLAAQVEMQAGAPVQAEAHLAKSLSLVPSAQPTRRMLASLYLDTGRPKKALEALEPLTIGPAGDPAAHVLAGQAHLMAGNVGAAEAAFARAATSMPQDSRVRTGQALAQVAKGQVDAGLATLEQVAAADRTALADLPLINQLIAKRAYAAAMAAVDRYADKVPGRPLPYLLKARVALAQGDNAAGRRALEAALERSPGYVPALTALGELDISEGKPDAARARIRAALDRDPADASLRVALADFTGRTGGTKEEVVTLMREAIRARPTDATIRADLVDFALAVGDHALALSVAQDAAAALPDHPLVLDRLGLALQTAGDIPQAIIAYDKVAAGNPSSVTAQLRLADAKMLAGSYDAALVHARRALSADPDSVLAQRVAIIAAARAGRAADARALVAQTKQQRKGDVIAWRIEAEAEQALGEPDRAVAALRKAQQLKPSTEGARLLHQVLDAAGMAAEADRHAQAWLKDHPSDLVFLLYLGEAASARQAYDKAEQLFKHVLRIKPQSLEALNNAAYVMARQKKPGAVALAEQAVKLAPNRPPLLDTLAVAYAAEGQIKRALDLQRQVVATSPDSPDYRFTLAQLQLQSGDKDAARENLVKLGKYGRAFSRHEEVNRLLKELAS